MLARKTCVLVKVLPSEAVSVSGFAGLPTLHRPDAA